MKCNCRWTEAFLGVVILIVTIWPSILGNSASMWVTIIAAAVLVLHSIFHHTCNCSMCMPESMPRARRKRR